MKRTLAAVVGGIAASTLLFAAPILLGLGALLMVLFAGGSPTGQCSSEGEPVSALPAGDLPTGLGTWDRTQLANAAAIVSVGAQRGISPHGQTIAVMTAMGESSLRNVEYGDDRFGVRNPDGTLTSSLGLFQQQKWWGTREQRLDPVYASGKFYDGLVKVPGWASMAPTLAAHAVQRNADPFHYARWWDDAVQVVAAVTGVEGLPNAVGGEQAPCTAPGDATAVTLEGWANPALGRNMSGYGPRNTGIPGASRFHLGQDIANTCGTPLYAAAAGTVTHAGLQRGAGNLLTIDHGQGVQTNYRHILSGTFLVTIGDQVLAGQQVAQMGGDKNLDPIGAGTSSGCHLHIEVVVNGEHLDPNPFFIARGITLGTAVATRPAPTH